MIAQSPLATNLELVLGYPSDWVCERNPGAARVERDVATWLAERGILTDELEHRRFEGLGVADYVGWPFPDARSPRFEVIACFLVLWIFYDDRLEEADDAMRPLLLRALTDGDLGDAVVSPHVAAWAELGRACAEVMPRTWCARHAERFVAWADAVREESAVATALRDEGRVPTPEDHLEARILNIGMIPNLDLLEFQRGYELDPAVLASEAVRQVERSSAAVVAIVNDLHARDKDRALRWPNLVSCFEARGRTEEEAFRDAVAMHDAQVRALDAASREVLARFAEEPAVRVWLRDVHRVVYGFARFHNRVPRYRNTFSLADGATLQLRVQPTGHTW